MTRVITLIIVSNQVCLYYSTFFVLPYTQKLVCILLPLIIIINISRNRPMYNFSEICDLYKFFSFLELCKHERDKKCALVNIIPYHTMTFEILH